jgi:hypothetical protein
MVGFWVIGYERNQLEIRMLITYSDMICDPESGNKGKLFCNIWPAKGSVQNCKYT